VAGQLRSLGWAPKSNCAERERLTNVLVYRHQFRWKIKRVNFFNIFIYYSSSSQHIWYIAWTKLNQTTPNYIFIAFCSAKCAMNANKITQLISFLWQFHTDKVHTFQHHFFNTWKISYVVNRLFLVTKRNKFSLRTICLQQLLRGYIGTYMDEIPLYRY
jgi:hypothetical protein